MSILSGLLFLVTSVMYIATVAIASDLHGSDAAGNGMAQGFGLVAAIAQWVFLGTLVVLAAMRGTAPSWVTVCGPVAGIAAAASVFAGFNLLADNFYRAKWPMVVVAVPPLLILALVTWQLSGTLRNLLPAPAFPIALFTGVAILAALPWPSTIYRAKNRSRDLEAYAAAAPQREQQQKDVEREKLLSLTPESPLRDWLEFTGDPELRAEAFAGIRKSPRRQSDAEQMFRMGFHYLLMYLPDLDLQSTAPVCEGSKRCLQEIAREMHPNPNSHGPIYFHDSQRIWEYRAGLEWLVKHGCNCGPEIDELDEVAHQYQDTPERQKFLDFLAGLRQ
jgi:hypothetical protein